MYYNIVNMGEFKKKDINGFDKIYYCVDLVLCTKSTIVKRIFIKKETYEKFLELFQNRLDMLTFDIEEYLTIEPDFNGEFKLKLFEEHILAI